MDLETLQKEFIDAWKDIKTYLDTQADEVKMQNEILSDLIDTQKEHDQILKELINRNL